MATTIPSPAATGLIDLPTEVLLEIFTACSSAHELTSLRSTCQRLSDVLKGHESMIVASVVANRVGIDLVPNVAAIVAVSKLFPYTSSNLERFVANYLESPISESFVWSLQDAQFLEPINTEVDYFVHEISRYMWPCVRNPEERVSRYQYPPWSPWDDTHFKLQRDVNLSVSETTRFKRVLYIYEMFCYFLRRTPPHIPLGNGMSVPLNQLNPEYIFWQRCYTALPAHVWEQLVCIQIYLGECINRVYEVSPRLSSPPEAGPFEVSPIGRHLHQLLPDDIDDIVCLGLRYLRRFLETAKINLRRAWALTPRYPIKNRRPHETRYLYHFTRLYKPYISQDIDFDIKIRNYPEDVKRTILAQFRGAPHWEEADNGPARIYREVEEEQPYYLRRASWNEYFIFWGYVFWDEARLVKLGAFSDRERNDGEYVTVRFVEFCLQLFRQSKTEN